MKAQRGGHLLSAAAGFSQSSIDQLTDSCIDALGARREMLGNQPRLSRKYVGIAIDNLRLDVPFMEEEAVAFLAEFYDRAEVFRVDRRMTPIQMREPHETRPREAFRQPSDAAVTK